jgi:SAM-dependent methyltransferase
VVEDYERLRPDYPAALVDDVLAYAGPTTRRALEVGAGTGKATRAFAARGLHTTAIEPDPAMAAELRRRCEPANTVVVESSFEDYRPSRQFDLLFSAQAWHWVDPDVRWERAASALADLGTIALFWNVDRVADPELRGSIVQLYQHYSSELVPDGEPVAEAAMMREWPAAELTALPTFDDAQAGVYRWDRVLSRPDYLRNIATHSQHRIMEPARRQALFEELERLLPETVAIAIDTVLYLARRTGSG